MQMKDQEIMTHQVSLQTALHFQPVLHHKAKQKDGRIDSNIRKKINNEETSIP